MMNDEIELPKGWELVTFNDVCEIISGKNQKEVVDDNGQYPIYGSGGKMGYANEYLCEPGTTIVGRKGTINKPIFVKERFWNVDTAFGLSPKLVYSRLLFHYFCLSFNFKKLDRSTAVPSLAKNDLLQISIPLLPLPEQHRIVSKIEELFSSLDKGIESLKAAQAQLKVYRQAVLKWAFEGRLTNVGVKEGELPEGWAWKKMGEISDKIQIGPFGTQLHREDYIENGIPLINPTHIQSEKIVPDFSYTISKEKAHSLPNYILQIGDVVLGRRGEMGRCGLVSEKENGWLCGTGSLYIRPSLKDIYPKFLHLLLSSATIKKYLEDNAAGTTMANLNSKIIHQIPIGVPEKLSEQHLIVAEIETRLSVCDKLEESIGASLLQAEALRQSILKKAFEGKLVPQDSRDEAAGVLLERIRGERETQAPSGRKINSKRKTKTVNSSVGATPT